MCVRELRLRYCCAWALQHWDICSEKWYVTWKIRLDTQRSAIWRVGLEACKKCFFILKFLRSPSTLHLHAHFSLFVFFFTFPFKFFSCFLASSIQEASIGCIFGGISRRNCELKTDPKSEDFLLNFCSEIPAAQFSKNFTSPKLFYKNKLNEGEKIKAIIEIE